MTAKILRIYFQGRSSVSVSLSLRAALLVTTGAAAVGFEIALVRAFTSRFGSTVEAAAIIVAVFLAALAAGALLLGRIADRAARPVQWFGWAAIAGGVFMLLAIPILARVAPLFFDWTFDDAAWIHAAGLLAIAVATVAVPGVCLGGTVAALVDRREGAREPGLLYAANTVGSVAGALLVGIVLIESLGVRASVLLCGLVALAAGAVGLALARRVPAREPFGAEDAAPSTRVPLHVGVAAFAAGSCALAVELLATRLLMQYLESSPYSFTVVLAVFLLGVAAGAALGARFLTRVDPTVVLPWLLAGLAAAAATTGAAIRWVAEGFDVEVARAISTQLGLALLVLPAPLVSGAIFSVLLGDASGRVRRSSHVGRITLINTAGGVVGSLLAGFVAIPAIGVKSSLLVAAGVAALAAAFVPARGRAFAAAGAGLVVALVVLGPVDLRAIPADPYFTRLLRYEEGPVANVCLLEAPGERRPVLFINRTTRQGGGESAKVIETKQGLLAALLHEQPRSALALGVGTGATVNGLLDAGVQSVHAVELIDSVLDMLPYFADDGQNLLNHPRVQVYRDDAVSFVRGTALKYDLVVGDLYFPWLDGAGSLYSVEHFTAVRDLLGSNGLFCQWIPMHQLRWEDFGIVARTFSRVFPQTWMFLLDVQSPHPLVGLVGAVDVVRIDVGRVSRALRSPRFQATYAAAGWNEPFDVLELYLGDQYTIEGVFGGDTAVGEQDLVNTVDRPILEYRAARTTEPEAVLALTNLNNIALQFGSSVMGYLEFDDDLSEAERMEFEGNLNKRAAALTQYLTGHYWGLRATVDPTDREGLEEKEAVRYLAGLAFDAKHPALNQEVAALSARQLASRRFADVVSFAGRVLTLNPDNAEVARNLGTAHLLLGEGAKAVAALDHTVKLDDVAANLMLLGMAHYLNGHDEAARANLENAYARSRDGFSSIAAAMVIALDGDPARATEVAAPLVDHEVWGVLARRAITRFQQQAESQENRG